MLQAEYILSMSQFMSIKPYIDSKVFHRTEGSVVRLRTTSKYAKSILNQINKPI